ncbi:MAG: hypothetical protein ACI906_000286 [Candidatus Latescibacterota bacterium]|jgi:hypothetical protein
MGDKMEGSGFAAKEASWLERFQRVFYAPKTSFTAVVGRESAWDWLLPITFTCLVALAAHYVTVDVAGSLDTPAVQERLDGLDEAQRQQYTRSVEMLRTQGLTMIPVGLFTSLVIVGGLLMAVARFIFHVELSFRQALIIKAYATLVVAPEWLVRAVLILAADSPFVYTGPGVFVGDAASATFFGRVLLGINFFDIWQVWIMGAGLAVLGGIGIKRATWALGVLWLLWLLGGSGLELLGEQAGLKAV